MHYIRGMLHMRSWSKPHMPVCLQVVNLPRGFAYVEFANREDAERARSHMDGGQLDGNVLR